MAEKLSSAGRAAALKRFNRSVTPMLKATLRSPTPVATAAEQISVALKEPFKAQLKQKLKPVVALRNLTLNPASG